MTTPLSQLQMLPSQSEHVYLPEKPAFLLAFQFSKQVIIVLGQAAVACLIYSCLWLVSVQLWAGVGGGNRNRHPLNFQGYLGCSDLLSQVLTEWVFLLLPDIPEQGGNKMMGVYQSR